MISKIKQAIEDGNRILQEKIEEKRLAKEKIKLNLIEKEKQRLLQDDYIYGLISEAVSIRNDCVMLANPHSDDNKDCLQIAINSIEGLTGVNTYYFDEERNYWQNSVTVTWNISLE